MYNENITHISIFSQSLDYLKTFPTVAQHNFDPSGDHLSKLVENPARFNGIDSSRSTSNIKISAEYKLATANKHPFGLHSMDETGLSLSLENISFFNK